jgi:hypothetical protein
MEILFFDSGQVKITEEGLSVPSFRDLYEGDKNKGKPHFKRYIEYIWYLYSKDSPYYDYSFKERVAVIEERIFHSTKKSWDSILSSVARLRDCVDEYNSLTKSREDRQYEKYMDDMDSYIDRLTNLPSSKKVKIKVDDKDEDGNVFVRDGYVEIENMDERSKARKEIKETYDMIDLIKERQRKKAGVTKRRYLRIFDNPEK